MKIDKEDVDVLCILTKKFTERAKEILEIIHDVRPISGYDYLDFERIDVEEDSVDFEGYETWAFDGYEDYSYDFPITLLYDKEALREFLNRLIERNNQDAANKKAKLDKETKLKKKKYEELKKEFGSEEEKKDA